MPETSPVHRGGKTDPLAVFRNGRSAALLIAVLAVNTVVAAQLSDEEHRRARAAASLGDYATAAAIWTFGAEKDDPIAQYNLALLYEAGLGVPLDVAKAEMWRARAARSGLVQAYNRQRPDDSPGLQPGSPAQTWDAAQWIERQDPARYTLQLASSQSRELIEKYISDYDLQGRAGYYRSRQKGETWYALCLGAYASAGEAQAAAAGLPEQLRKWSPWVRPIKDIHRVMQR